jgi:hypothetical protein
MLAVYARKSLGAFKPRTGAFLAKDHAELERAKSALADLFKK